MPNIITPIQLWNNFDDSLSVTAITLKQTFEDGVKFEHVSLLGRETEDGRVKIFGVFACDEANPSDETVIVFNDSTAGIDKSLLKLFVKNGYSAFMVDYRGEWDGAENFTLYPHDIDYANTARCGRFRDFVDDNAVKTSWYEWVAVGIYARKYVLERTGNDNIGVVGLRDGGEIAWKLAVAKSFKCVVTVCAAGWKAYHGVNKYGSEEISLNDERYRFIGGIDSQAYAPYVKCPMLILCSTNDKRFDYDRAYDTFSRINHEFIQSSVVSYSLQCDQTIGIKSCTDMFLFLDKNLKQHNIFIPKPVEVNVTVDENDNLVARAVFDNQGIIEDFGMYMAEDCHDSSLREWTKCPHKSKISEIEQEFYLNIYRKTITVFALCYAKYSSGFTVWSKIAVKKISGKFRNMQEKCRVLYTGKEGVAGFTIADPSSRAIGGMFFTDSLAEPELVEKENSIKGIYSERGLTTYRFNSPRYAPENGNLLKIDVFCDETADMIFTIVDSESGEIYKFTHNVLGGVWQSVILESKMFKTLAGVPLGDFVHNLKFSVNCEVGFAVNNIMWL